MSGHCSRPHRWLLAAALVGAVAIAGSAAAYEYPSVEHGFKPERAFHVGDVDHIRLFNGGLEMTIPIGQRYPVGGNFSYGLTLTYSHQVWDYISAEIQFPEPHEVTQAWPTRNSNAGLGWRLSLGEFSGLSATGAGACRNCYISASGARESFGISSIQPKYTADGTYLRLRTVPGGWEVDFPNGETHRFDSLGRLTQMRDPFGNAANVTYGAGFWRITDTQGRIQTVYLRSAPYYSQVVDRVVVSTFGGTSATYRFQYSNETIARSCLDTDPETSRQIFLPILTAVELPDLSRYSMPVADYNLPLSTGPCDQSISVPLEGLIEAMTLPTGGRVEWNWGIYNFPVPIENENQPDPPWLEKTAGVSRRTLRNSDGTVHGEWTYTQLLPGGQNAVEAITQVQTPLGDRTDHYFLVGDEPDTRYGLSISLLESAPGRPDLFRSSKVYDCGTSGGNCQLRRTTYLKYAGDGQPGAGGEFNPRVEAQYTRYHDDDDRWKAVDHSSYAGGGRYRTSSTSGNFDAGNQRTTTTQYHPVPLPTESWILGTYDSLQVTEAGQTTREEFCFDRLRGYLLRHRLLLNGTVRQGKDLMTVFTRDNSGNTIREQRYGSDFGTVGTGSVCSTGLGSEQSRVDHGYQHGVRSTSRFFRADGTNMGFYTLDRTIDRDSGLPSSARDTALVATTFTWDTLGRLTAATPATDAKTTYAYTRAQGTNFASVAINQVANGGSQVRTQERLVFDSFGRPHVEEQRMPDGAWSKRTTFYNALGWKTDVSEWEPTGGAHTAFTQYRNFDPFGRSRRIVPPDGAAHEVNLTYFGDRVTVRTAWIATGASGAESKVSTTSRRDRQGRLYQVVEPSGPGGGAITTTYSYDEGGRLTRVGSGPSQVRTFAYDNRGFLTRECHPEKGSLGNGCVTYGNYNSFGSPGRQTDGPNDLRLLYDRAGRLVDIEEWGGQRRPLKHWTFGTGTGAGDRSRGKVRIAERYNYVFLGPNAYTDLVRETYTYGGRGGRPSQRRTENFINPQPGSTPSDSFLQSFAWNDLGDVESLGYPYRLGLPVGRTVTFGYTRGRLTSIAGWVPQIKYHSNGMVDQIRHQNLIYDLWRRDPNHMQRPDAINAWYRPGTPEATPRFLSRTYGYDGSGNVKTMGNAYFVYDKVSRLTEGRIYPNTGGGGTQLRQSYVFDTYGNIQTIITNGVTRNTPTSSATNRLTSGVYDAAGNLTAYNGAIYEYGPFNEMWRHKNGSEESVYIYTADDERLWQYNSDLRHQWTIRDLGGKVLREYIFNNPTNQWHVERDYVYRGGALVGAATPQGTRHFTVDHLGTPRLITDASGNYVAHHTYYPFGEEATTVQQDGERMKFTGHERDLHSPAGAGDDIDYMHARFCSPVTARFLSVDPKSRRSAMNRPQRWNRYAYAIGNPISFTDPDGRDITYGHPKDKQFYEKRAAKNARVRAVLEAFAPGTGRNLTIRRGDAGSHPGSGTKRRAYTDSFFRDASPDELLAAYNEAGGGEKGTAAAEALDQDFKALSHAEIVLGSGATAETKLHELGHVEQGLLRPKEAIEQAKAAEVMETNKEYQQSDSERYANEFAAAAAKNDPKEKDQAPNVQ